MEPKFQSSFIPRSTVISQTKAGIPRDAGIPRMHQRSILAFLAKLIFAISVILAFGMFGAKLYLNYRINAMSINLEEARSALDPDTIDELTRLDNRIVSANKLLANHLILSPFFEFLESSTVKNVRFDEFTFSINEDNPFISISGEAIGYTSLALQADILSESGYFRELNFDNIRLNDQGNVAFSLKAMLDSDLVSYTRLVEEIGIPPEAPPPVEEEIPAIPIDTNAPI